MHRRSTRKMRVVACYIVIQLGTTSILVPNMTVVPCFFKSSAPLPFLPPMSGIKLQILLEKKMAWGPRT